jgi:hypothetical protein
MRFPKIGDPQNDGFQSYKYYQISSSWETPIERNGFTTGIPLPTPRRAHMQRWPRCRSPRYFEAVAAPSPWQGWENPTTG